MAGARHRPLAAWSASLGLSGVVGGKTAKGRESALCLAVCETRGSTMIARKHTQKAAQKTMTPNGATPQLSQGTHFPTQAGKRFLSCSFPLTPTPTSLRGVVDNHGIIKRTLFRTSGEALPPTSRSPSRCTWRSQKALAFCSLTTFFYM